MESDNRKKSCCFFGHRTIEETKSLTENLAKTVEGLIADKGVTYFYFGSNSKFDELCHKVVTDLKEKYPHIRRIYVRSDFPDISDSYKGYLLESFEGTYFPERIRGAGKAAYVERNQEMVNQACFCVVYFDESYVPPKSKNSKSTDEKPQSGTKIAYAYAGKKRCEIINLFTKEKLS